MKSGFQIHWSWLEGCTHSTRTFTRVNMGACGCQVNLHRKEIDTLPWSSFKSHAHIRHTCTCVFRCCVTLNYALKCRVPTCWTHKSLWSTTPRHVKWCVLPPGAALLCGRLSAVGLFTSSGSRDLAPRPSVPHENPSVGLLNRGVSGRGYYEDLSFNSENGHDRNICTC